MSKYLVYLVSDQGDSGECFRSETELHAWFYDTMGRWPNRMEKKDMREGHWFIVGSRSYRAERRQSNSLTAVA